MKDYPALAMAMLEPHRDAPGPRSIRIAGIYAALYLEDPLRFAWCGLASFVARQVSYALTAGGVGVGEMLADGNLRIYSSVGPDLLRLRDRVEVTSLLAPGFRMLREADALAATDGPAALARSVTATATLSRLEQREVVQPSYDGLNPARTALLTRFLYFRLGWDDAAPVLQFAGRCASDPDERIAWMEADVLPRWEAWRRSAPEQVRADVDRVRRACGVRGELLQIAGPAS